MVFFIPFSERENLMKLTNRLFHCCLVRTGFICAMLIASGNLSAEENEFTSTTIDLGVVVSDIQKSIEFYTKAVGFKEIQGFSVAGDFAADAGLTDYHKLDIHVLVLGDDASATRLKLMQLPGVNSKTSDNSHIHSQLGFSYITVEIADTNAAMKRLEKAGVKPLAKGPAGLPAPLPQDLYLTVIRDPDGNFVELVGPKK